jgi:hypothetical protein
LRAIAQEDGLIPRERGSLEELRLDLSVELTDRPATSSGFSLIELARLRAPDG